MTDTAELLPGFHAVGLALHMPEHEALAFADVHLGYEEALNKQGILVPRFQYRDIARHVNDALKRTKPKTVIINGDLKHEFGTISSQEWAEVMRFLDELRRYDVVLVKGNHDTIIGPIATRKDVKTVDEYRLGTTLFVHGNRKPKSLKGVETIIMGHEHPCIGLTEEGRTEKVKCFLVGGYEGRDLIVLPSMNSVTEGADILRERPMSPLMGGDIGGFKAYGVEEGAVLYFGAIKDIPCRFL
jgi:uncharacterized protein